MREPRIPPPLRAAAALLAALAIALAGCAAGGDGPPAIARGASCARCGMGIADLKFATTRRVAEKWRAYDSIECLLADRSAAAGGSAWLTDYETKTLLPEAEAWVLHGDFPSPMGGGLAAFADRAAAESLAVATHGTVSRLAAVAPARGAP